MAQRAEKACETCGAKLKLRPARCPLCGDELTDRAPTKEAVDDYQSSLRDLRDQLRALRDGAEAV